MAYVKFTHSQSRRAVSPLRTLTVDGEENRTNNIKQYLGQRLSPGLPHLLLLLLFMFVLDCCFIVFLWSPVFRRGLQLFNQLNSSSCSHCVSSVYPDCFLFLVVCFFNWFHSVDRTASLWGLSLLFRTCMFSLSLFV